MILQNKGQVIGLIQTAPNNALTRKLLICIAPIHMQKHLVINLDDSSLLIH